MKNGCKTLFAAIESGLGKRVGFGKNQLATFGVVVCLTAYSSFTLAASGELKERIQNCTTIQVSADRLHCFDDVAGSLAIPNSEPLGEKYLSNPSKPYEKKVQSYSLVDMTQDKKKRWVFKFNNGQIWRQIEPRRLPKLKQLPMPAHLSTGVFGSFDLRIEDFSRTVKVKRLR